VFSLLIRRFVSLRTRHSGVPGIVGVMQRASLPAVSYSGLPEAVDRAIIELDDLRGHDVLAERHALDRWLRSALAVHVGRTGTRTGAVPALRVACAHLAAGDLAAAHAALTATQDLLNAQRRPSSDPA
jgi:hypothetical protein